MVANGFQLKDKGFTLLEVILVLILISIFAAIAVSRQPATDVTLKSQQNALKSHIRYAQMRAMNTDTVWGIGYSSTAYWLFRQASEIRRFLPGEDQATVELNLKGMTIATGDSNRLAFDTWGRPYSNDVLLIQDPLLIQLIKNEESETVEITPDTGFVP